MQSRENWENPVKGENSYQNQLPHVSASSAWWREENTISYCPFPNPDPVVIDPFSPRDSCYLLFGHYLSLSFGHL